MPSVSVVVLFDLYNNVHIHTQCYTVYAILIILVFKQTEQNDSFIVYLSYIFE